MAPELQSAFEGCDEAGGKPLEDVGRGGVLLPESPADRDIVS